MKRAKHILFVLLTSLLTSYTVSAQAPGWVWAKGVHTTASEWATDVAVDPLNGDVVTVGVFNSDLSAFFGSQFAGVNGGGFVARYNPAGNLIWAFPIGNNNDDACNGVTVSANGNIYVTGYLQNTADFKGMSSTSTVLSSAGGKDAFVAKYNSLGQVQWARRGGGVADDEGYAVCTNANAVFVCGYFTASGNFSSIPTISNQPNQNLFVTAYDANGGILWLTDAGSGQNTFARDLAADNNNVYITGDFLSSTLQVYDYTGANVANLANANASKTDAFVMSLSVNGPFNWLKGIHSNGDDFGRGINENLSGIFVTGGLSAAATFPGYTANPVAPAAQGLDMYVAQLDKSTGIFNWVAAEPGNSDEEGFSITLDTLNLVSVAGYFNSAMTFAGSTNIVSLGNEDIFIAAYNNSGIFQWANKAGNGGVDIPYGVAAGPLGEIYLAGEYESNAKFGTIFLSIDSPKNIFLAKLGCTPVTNNIIGAPQTICSGQTPASLNGSIPGGGSPPYTYLWQQSANGTTWTAASGANSNQNYNPPSLTSATFYRRLAYSLSGCIDSDTSSSLFIQVDQPPTTAFAGKDSLICGNTINLWGNTPLTGIGAWQVIAGGATVTSVSSHTSAVIGLSPGINLLIWKISNGVCAVSRDTVKITAFASPGAANAGNDQSVCASSYTLNASPPLAGTGNWQVIAGAATVASVSSANSTVNSLSAGTNSFVWTISNGPCPVSKDTVVITRFLPPSTSIAGADQAVCSNSVSLAANAPSIGTGAWVVLSGGATIANPGSNITTATGLSGGVNNFMWVISNGNCPASRDTVAVNTSTPPSNVNAGLDQRICSTTASLNAAVPSSGNGQWSVVAGGGTITNPNGNAATASGLSIGANTFVWTVSNGTCPAVSDTLQVFVDAAPSTADAGPSLTVCGTATVINAVQPTVGAGTWAMLSGGGIVASPNAISTAVSGLMPGANVYQWQVNNGICPPSSDTLTVFVYLNPSLANAGPDQNVAAPTATLSANTPLVGNGSWSVVSGSGQFSSVTNPSAGVTGLSIGDNIFAWTISNGACAASGDEVTIHLNELIIPNGFSPDGDLVNDNFEIPGIDGYGSAKLEVFNRWGNLVYENSSYRNDWNGRNGAGEILTDDTYFYTLRINDAKTYKGFVVLKRK